MAISPPRVDIRSLVAKNASVDLDAIKGLFCTKQEVTWAKVPNRSVQSFMQQLPRDSLLTLPKFKPVQVLDSEHRKVYLSSAEHVEYPLSRDTVELGFDNWSMEQVLSAMALTAPGSFETAGHLVRLNLPDEMDDVEAAVIGQVILHKLPHVRTVVRKVQSIESQFRTLPIQLIAGVEDYVVSVKESDCHFTFDYSQVYWNSRLQHEHSRLVGLFAQSAAVCDMMCGVGPFAVPAARHRQCRVWANDLNPASVHWLRANCAKNHVKIVQDDDAAGQKGGHVKVFNLDGRDFVRRLATAENSPAFDHVVMNLPALAVTFMDVFDGDVVRGRFCHARWHVYLFARPGQDPVGLLRAHLHPTVQSEDEDAHWVRNVAPNKDMYCVSFRLADRDSRSADPEHEDGADPELAKNDDDSAKRRKLAVNVEDK